MGIVRRPAWTGDWLDWLDCYGRCRSGRAASYRQEVGWTELTDVRTSAAWYWLRTACSKPNL